MINDYWEDYRLPTPPPKKKFTMHQVKDEEIRRKVAKRTEPYYANTGRTPSSEIKERWVKLLEQGKRI